MWFNHKSKKYFIIFVLSLFLIIASFFFFTPKPSLLNNISYSKVVYDDHGNLLRITLSKDEKYRIYTPLTQISPKLIQATLLQEDQYFYKHPGVNPIALVKAAFKTYFTSQRQYGASTLTMQLARMRFHINTKTISGKITQIIRAFQIEMFYSKDQILEAYFNLASYGGNVEGIGAASLIYYGKTAQQLTLGESLSLAVVPQNPPRRQPSVAAIKILQNAKLRLFARWLQIHPEDKTQTEMIALPMQIIPRQLPFLAPHFVNQVLAQNPQENILHTTLDLQLQNQIEKVLHRYMQQHQQQNIKNATVLLVDDRDMSVKALIGSASFFDNNISGQVNGTNAKRSPGSTLKPFIYALALDQGLIHPLSILKDAPTSYGNYNPENFDNDFMGPINATDALRFSRNIPAITLANQLHAPTLYQFLINADVAKLKSEKHYGLALVLGGGEVTMQELVGLYGVLANLGVWQPLKFIDEDNVSDKKRLLSKEASFLTLLMLQNTPRPENIYLNKKFAVYWKTGTSSGYRDAWSVGVFGHYILAVWVGDFQNKSQPVFKGAEVAAPLFFSIIENISAQPHFQNYIFTPDNSMSLKKVKICSASGLLTTRYCQNQIETWFIPGKSPIKKDDVFREIAINNKTGLRACRFDENIHFETYEFWPSDILQIYEKAGIAKKTPPAFDADCNSLVTQSNGISPRITSPKMNMTYQIEKNNRDPIIPFSANVDADVKKLYWFVNENFVGITNRNENYYWSEIPGNYIVRVVDDHGRSDAMNLKVIK